MLLLLATSCSQQSKTPFPLDGAKAESTSDGDRPSTCVAGALAPEVIRFSITPYLDADLLSSNFEPVLEYLNKRTGYTFEIVPVEGYASVVGDLEEGRVDVASLSPLTYVQARDRMPCLQLLLTQVSFGSVSYSGYLVSRADSTVSSINDLRGKRLAFTTVGSASGYLYPKAFMLERGERVEEYFGAVEFAGDHLTALKLLLDGKVDAAATFSSFMRPARASDLEVGNLRVLAVTGRIPHDAIVARPGLPPGIAKSIQEALADLNTASEEGREILGGHLDINGWVRTKDSLYDSVREKLGLVVEGIQ